MKRKLKDYFRVGVRLVWFIDPDKRQGKMYTAPRENRGNGADSFLGF
jgi:Uma2 family endonuclease